MRDGWLEGAEEDQNAHNHFTNWCKYLRSKYWITRLDIYKVACKFSQKKHQRLGRASFNKKKNVSTILLVYQVSTRFDMFENSYLCPIMNKWFTEILTWFVRLEWPIDRCHIYNILQKYSAQFFLLEGHNVQTSLNPRGVACCRQTLFPRTLTQRRHQCLPRRGSRSTLAKNCVRVDPLVVPLGEVRHRARTPRSLLVGTMRESDASGGS
jgi:hypothetical protein